MKIFSFFRYGIELHSVEVEVSLMPGLPQFQFMGLPDTVIKESQLRIKSALKHQGFNLSGREQVFVNLRPPHLKKTSQGLDLAVAAAYLWKTGQMPIPRSWKLPIYVYGELNLEGEVTVPEDLDSLLEVPKGGTLLTGYPVGPLPYDVFGIQSLNELGDPKFFEKSLASIRWERPQLSDRSFGTEGAELLAVVATGEHSLFLAGPAGSGKSTLTDSIYELMSDPDPNEFLRSRQIGRICGREPTWRPLVAPHHTIPTLSMVGGGSPPLPGEVTRAHGGVLLLDEFLEYKGAVKEALREPIEKGEITISRLGSSRKFPARFLLLATSNLCPCGNYVPGRFNTCRFSLRRCQSYLERLSGPLLDRFAILTMSQNIGKEERSIPLTEIRTQVIAAQAFALKSRSQSKSNSQLTAKEIEVTMKGNMLAQFMPKAGGSQRRQQAILRVARTIADLANSAEIRPHDLGKAARLTLHSFESIKNAFS